MFEYLVDGKSPRAKALAACLALMASVFAPAANAQTIPPIPPTGETAKSADGLVDMLGVNTHLYYSNSPYVTAFDTIIKPKLQLLGVRHIREMLGNVASPSWISHMQQLGQMGMDFDFVVDPRIWPDPTAVPAFARQFVPLIRSFEGPNEMDLVPSVTYQGQPFPSGEVNYEADLYLSLKSDPMLAAYPVALGAMGYDSSDFLKICALTPCPVGFADMGTMHSYAGAAPPSTALDRNLANTVLAAGTMPVMASETGYHTDTTTGGFPGISGTAQGSYISRLPFEYYSRGVSSVYLYELIDEPNTSQEAQRHFGLLTATGQEKPGFTALKRTIGLLADPGPAFDLPTLHYTLGSPSNIPPSLHRMVLAKRDGRIYLVLWQEVMSYDPILQQTIAVPSISITVTLGDRFRQANLYEPLMSGALRSGMAYPRMMRVDVPDHPIILELIP